MYGKRVICIHIHIYVSIYIYIYVYAYIQLHINIQRECYIYIYIEYITHNFERMLQGLKALAAVSAESELRR